MASTNLQPTSVIKKEDSGGGIRMRAPWTYLCPPEPMTRSLEWGCLVFFSHIPNDPAAFLKVNGDLGYMDGDKVVTTWYTCVSTGYLGCTNSTGKILTTVFRLAHRLFPPKCTGKWVGDVVDGKQDCKFCLKAL